MSSVSFATTNKEVGGKLYSSSAEERRALPHYEKVEELVEMGNTLEDAEYYATLDDNIYNAEKNNIVMELDNVTEMTNREIFTNQELLRIKS